MIDCTINQFEATWLIAELSNQSIKANVRHMLTQSMNPQE